MTLVERLRDRAEKLYDGNNPPDSTLGVIGAELSEAADEIERLRAELAEWYRIDSIRVGEVIAAQAAAEAGARAAPLKEPT